MRTHLIPLILALCACTGKSDGDSGGAGGGEDSGAGTGGEEDGPVTGRLSLSFGIDVDHQDLMEEDAIGPFWGSFYDADDVTGVGPNDGAVALGSIHVEEIDLREGPSAVLFTSEDLTAQKIVVLGFLDSDGNATPGDEGPDDKDPVTLPGDNRFTLVGGETAEVQVWFGLLNP
jgi:hypothetical protein